MLIKKTKFSSSTVSTTSTASTASSISCAVSLSSSGSGSERSDGGGKNKDERKTKDGSVAPPVASRSTCGASQDTNVIDNRSGSTQNRYNDLPPCPPPVTSSSSSMSSSRSSHRTGEGSAAGDVDEGKGDNKKEGRRRDGKGKKGKNKYTASAAFADKEEKEKDKDKKKKRKSGGPGRLKRSLLRIVGSSSSCDSSAAPLTGEMLDPANLTPAHSDQVSRMSDDMSHLSQLTGRSGRSEKSGMSGGSAPGSVCSVEDGSNGSKASKGLKDSSASRNVGTGDPVGIKKPETSKSNNKQGASPGPGLGSVSKGGSFDSKTRPGQVPPGVDPVQIALQILELQAVERGTSIMDIVRENTKEDGEWGDDNDSTIAIKLSQSGGGDGGGDENDASVAPPPNTSSSTFSGGGAKRWADINRQRLALSVISEGSEDENSLISDRYTPTPKGDDKYSYERDDCSRVSDMGKGVNHHSRRYSRSDREIGWRGVGDKTSPPIPSENRTPRWKKELLTPASTTSVSDVRKHHSRNSWEPMSADGDAYSMTSNDLSPQGGRYHNKYGTNGRRKIISIDTTDTITTVSEADHSHSSNYSMYSGMSGMSQQLCSTFELENITALRSMDEREIMDAFKLGVKDIWESMTGKWGDMAVVEKGVVERRR